MVEPQIRAARHDETQLLSDLAFRSKAHWGYDDTFMAACREELTVTAGGIARCPTFVYGNGTARGFYQLTFADKTADVALLFVDPPAIGRGVGRELWRHLVAQARHACAASITIEADPDPEGFHLRMGAIRVGTAPSASIRDRQLPLLAFAID